MRSKHGVRIRGARGGAIPPNGFHGARNPRRSRRHPKVSSHCAIASHNPLTCARSFNFDADVGLGFSDSDLGDDVDSLRAFNQEVYDDAQDASQHDEDESDQDSGVAAASNDAIDTLKENGEAAAAAEEEPSDSDNEDILINDEPEPEPEVKDGTVADDEEVAAALPASSEKKKLGKSSAKSPAKKPAKPTPEPSTKTTTKAPPRPAAKAAPRKARKPKKELPPEKPTRTSDRVSKPRARAAAQSTVQPRSAAPKPKATKRKTASRVASPRKTSGQQWEVESIVDSIIDADTHQHFYQVKWKGFSKKDNTWEPKVNLANCQAAIKQFEGSIRKRGRPKSS